MILSDNWKAVSPEEYTRLLQQSKQIDALKDEIQYLNDTVNLYRRLVDLLNNVITARANRETK